MKNINTLLIEMANQAEKRKVKNIPIKNQEWFDSKDKLLVEILRRILKDKSK